MLETAGLVAFIVEEYERRSTSFYSVEISVISLGQISLVGEHVDTSAILGSALCYDAAWQAHIKTREKTSNGLWSEWESRVVYIVEPLVRPYLIE